MPLLSHGTLRMFLARATLTVLALTIHNACSNSSSSPPVPEVLVAGGFGGSGSSLVPLATAELYNTTNGNWACVGGQTSSSPATCNPSMSDSRAGHTGTTLQDGRVLIAGGVDSSGVALNTAELYQPSTGSFVCVGGVSSSPPLCNPSMQDAREFHTATLLGTGLVLLAGGLDKNAPGSEVPTAELFDPASGTFSTVASTMSSPRALHAAALLATGDVLITGGLNGNQTALATADVYKTAVNTFVPANNLNTARYSHTATLLPNGQVLIAGGFDVNNSPLNSAELYDPATNSFTLVPNTMTSPRAGHTATLLPDGTVLIAGGQTIASSTAQGTNTAEIYDPTTQTFTATKTTMVSARVDHVAVLLPNGTVLLAGGVNGAGEITNSAEIYNPATGTFSAANFMFVAREAPSANSVQQP